jgi:LysR family transcriptional activator of dmlA
VSLLPPLDDVKVFVTAARLEGFSAAAQELDVSPAYISKRIGLLEKTLGVKLFLRSARHVRLTVEGKIALDGSERLLDTFAQMQLEIGREQQVPRGRIRIATSTGFGCQCVAPIIADLVVQYPELEIDLELLDRPIDLISEGFDIELRVGGALAQNLIAKPLAINYRVLCAAPSYLEHAGVPRTLQDLNQQRCIGIRERDQSYGRWRLETAKGSVSIQLAAALMTNNGEVAKQWCLSGQGIMLRSLWNIKDELASGALVRILPAYWQPAHINAIYPARLETSAKLRACVTHLEAELHKYVSPLI